MTETERLLLAEALRHADLALESLDRLIGFCEKKGMGDHDGFRERLVRICRSSDISYEKKVRLVAAGMKRFSFLCRLDIERDILKSFRDDLTRLAAGRRIPYTDIPYWRSEYYANMAAVFVLDYEIGESG